jgi:hypothetical protein
MKRPPLLLSALFTVSLFSTSVLADPLPATTAPQTRIANRVWDVVHGHTVSEKVGPLVEEAQNLALAGDYKGARAKLDEADAVKSYPDDVTVINQIRQYIEFNDLHTPAPPSLP